MRNHIFMIAAGMAFLGVLVAGCENKQAEQKPASEQAPAPAPAPAKKAPQGC